MKKCVMSLLCLWGTLGAVAQDKLDVKFGKIRPSDFEISSPLIDSGTNALILFDIGSSEFAGNEKGGFSLIFRHHLRIRILNTKGFDVATVAIPFFYYNNMSEQVEELSANTYNLENGAVITTKLSNKDVFSEDINKRQGFKKFTFPAIQPGSIIEYVYEVKTDNTFNLRPWTFQGKYPCLWSEYTVAVPEYFSYVTLSQGYLPYAIQHTDAYNRMFHLIVEDARHLGHGVNLSASVTENRWVVKNAPPLKQENFTSTLRNHLSKVEFQLSAIHYPNQPVKPVLASWADVSEKMQENVRFGAAYAGSNGWLDDDMKLIVTGASGDEAKARKIYAYVRDHFTCTSHQGTELKDRSLKEIFKAQSGSVGEINLLLVAMLRHESIPCDPVLLSLRDRGLVHPMYPLMERFNYVICEAQVANRYVYLDACHPALGFGKLTQACYNGVAWALSKTPAPVYFVSDSVRDDRRTSIVIVNNEQNQMEGSVNAIMGDFSSYSLREKLGKMRKEEYERELARQYGNDIRITGLTVDSLHEEDQPLAINYSFKLPGQGDDIIYFNPMQGHQVKQNPFKSAERLYPVEMPYASNDVVVLTMDIPKGYKVDEIPKSVRYKLNETDGLFEYIVVKRPDQVQLRSVISINKATFPQEDYQSLREFFSYIIQKQSEQIVFKKIP